MKLTPAELDAVTVAVLARLIRRAPEGAESIRPTDPRVQMTIDVVVACRQCSRAQMLSSGRGQPGAWGRAVGMWLLREVWSMPYAEITHAFGRTHHTTAVHACQTVEDRRDTEPATRDWTNRARRRLFDMAEDFQNQSAVLRSMRDILAESQAARAAHFRSPITHNQAHA